MAVFLHRSCRVTAPLVLSGAGDPGRSSSIQAGRLALWVVLISAVFILGGPALVPEVSVHGPLNWLPSVPRGGSGGHRTACSDAVGWALAATIRRRRDSPAESTGPEPRRFWCRSNAAAAPRCRRARRRHHRRRRCLWLVGGARRSAVADPSRRSSGVPDDHETRVTRSVRSWPSGSPRPPVTLRRYSSPGTARCIWMRRPPGGGFDSTAALQTEIDAALAPAIRQSCALGLGNAAPAAGARRTGRSGGRRSLCGSVRDRYRLLAGAPPGVITTSPPGGSGERSHLPVLPSARRPSGKSVCARSRRTF